MWARMSRWRDSSLHPARTEPAGRSLLRSHQRGGDITHHLQRVRGDLVERVLGRVVRRVIEVDHIDRVDSRIEKWNMVVCDALVRRAVDEVLRVAERLRL